MQISGGLVAFIVGLPDKAVGESRGRICLINNAAERALRCVGLGRRNWTFCGSDRGGERAASIYTLIATAKLNDIILDSRRGWQTCCVGSTTIPPAGSTRFCPGTGLAQSAKRKLHEYGRSLPPRHSQ